MTVILLLLVFDWMILVPRRRAPFFFSMSGELPFWYAPVLPIWDSQFDTDTNEVIVAVDFDQGKNQFSKILYKAEF